MSDVPQSTQSNPESFTLRLSAIVAKHHDDGLSQEHSGRRLRRCRRGLPTEEDLLKLATVYIEMQRELWPRLVEARYLPDAAPEPIADLAEEFATKFVTKTMPEFLPPSGIKLWEAIGSSYLRYSSLYQNPRSLDDQLAIQLKHSQCDQKVFVPWHYVFADAGVSGAIAQRTGYLLAKEALHLTGPARIDILFVDEMSRATRDDIEPLQLERLVTSLGKRIISVSDGIDSQDEFSKMKIHFYAMFNQQSLAQHSQRVRRGIEGARRRGTIHGKIPLGYKAIASRRYSQK